MTKDFPGLFHSTHASSYGGTALTEKDFNETIDHLRKEGTQSIGWMKYGEFNPEDTQLYRQRLYDPIAHRYNEKRTLSIVQLVLNVKRYRKLSALDAYSHTKGWAV